MIPPLSTARLEEHMAATRGLLAGKPPFRGGTQSVIIRVNYVARYKEYFVVVYVEARSIAQLMILRGRERGGRGQQRARAIIALIQRGEGLPRCNA